MNNSHSWRLHITYATYHDKVKTRIRNTNFKSGENASVLQYTTVLETTGLAGAVVTELSHTIRSNNAAKEIFVLLSPETEDWTNIPWLRFYGGYVRSWTFVASGQTLFQGDGVYNTLLENSWNYDLQTPYSDRYSCGASLLRNLLNTEEFMSPNHVLIRPGWNCHPGYNSGMIPLKGLTDPTVTISQSTINSYQFLRCLIKHFVFVRTDPDNGVITTSVTT